MGVAGDTRAHIPDAQPWQAAPAVRGAAGIAAVIRRSILDGAYRYGERLPAERDLATHFTASRGTVRQALRQLEDMRLVARRVGSGTYVQYRDQRADQSDIARVTSPLELIDVRLGVEPPMTRLAVLNATADDIERMQSALDRVVAAGVDPERFSRGDEAFHLCLAECSRNPLMVWLYEQVNAVRRETLWNARKDRILTPARIAEYNEQHRAVLEAVRQRDVEGAVAIITRHLEDARADLVGTLRESATAQGAAT